VRYELLLRDTLKRREGLLMVVSTSLAQFTEENTTCHKRDDTIISVADKIIETVKSHTIEFLAI
jgi:hypothetical protein